ncbi:MAG TPA: hypothetical protein DIU15_20700 [Deltaproteobacteria bacterium]|nr:hypothetical protein [Deltaproteobacteria bacterium]HCP48469.1 hypothetical protein [Deltaproteobacteria bacterium]
MSPRSGGPWSAFSPTGSAVPLLVLLLLGVLLRLPSLAAPPLDSHHVRQADTASIARNMLRHGVDLLGPRIDWAGPEAGTVESEFPLYASGVALLWKLTGVTYVFDYRLPRLLSIAGWLLGGIALFRWVRRRLRGPPWLYLILYTLSPLAIVFSRNIQPDALAVGLLLLALERADACDEQGRAGLGSAALSVVLGALAVACKGTLAFHALLIPALIVARSRRLFWALGAGLVLIVLPAFWYWHAHFVLGAEGATFGIWGSKAHKWGSLAVWLDPMTWRAILGAFIVQTVSPIGVVLVILGARRAVGQPEMGPFALALVLGLVAAVTVAEGFRLHNYYQLMLVPFCSVLVGLGISDLLERLRAPALERRVRLAALATLAGVVLLSLLWGLSFVRSSLQLDDRIAMVSLGVQAVLPRNRSVIAVDVHPQSLLYSVDRRGWHRTRMDAREVRRLQGLGAEYFLVTNTSSTASDERVLGYLQVAGDPVAHGPGWSLHRLKSAPPVAPRRKATPPPEPKPGAVVPSSP